MNPTQLFRRWSRPHWAGRPLLVAGLLFSLAPPGRAESAIDPQLGAPLTQRLRPTHGSSDAPVVVIEVRSFKCAHCRAFHETVFPTLLERQVKPGKVHWVSINATPDSADTNAAVFLLARCALRTGNYPQIEPFLFKNGSRTSSFLYSKAASSLPEADAAELNACVRSGETLGEVRQDFAEVTALKVTVLPTFILRKRRPDGTFVETRIEGYPPADHFERTLQQLLAQP